MEGFPDNRGDEGQLLGDAGVAEGVPSVLQRLDMALVGDGRPLPAFSTAFWAASSQSVRLRKMAKATRNRVGPSFSISRENQASFSWLLIRVPFCFG